MSQTWRVSLDGRNYHESEAWLMLGTLSHIKIQCWKKRVKGAQLHHGFGCDRNVVDIELIGTDQCRLKREIIGGSDDKRSKVITVFATVHKLIHKLQLAKFIYKLS